MARFLTASRALRTGYLLTYALVALAGCLSLFTGDWKVEWYDSPSYFEAAQSLSWGMADRVRTPLYPALILLLDAIAGKGAVMTGLRVVQWGLFFVGVGVMKRTAVRLWGDGVAALAATALFALYPAYWVYNDSILTESLAVTMTVFMVGAITRGQQTRSRAAVVMAWVWLAALLALRPALVGYLPVVAVWGLMVKGRRCLSGVMLALTVGLLGGYTALMRHTYGISRLTTVSATNTFATLRLNGFIAPTDYADPYTRASLECAFAESGTVPTLEEWGGENLTSMVLLGPQGYDRMIAEAAGRYRGEMAGCVVRRVERDVAAYPLFEHRLFFWRYVRNAPPSPSILWGAWGLAVTGIALLGAMAVRRRWMPVAFVLCGLPAALMVTAIAGAQGEFTRLFTPAMPVMMLWGVWLVVGFVETLFGTFDHLGKRDGHGG